MNNSKGFSLTGTLMGIGMLGMISLGLARVMSDASSSTVKLAQKLELLAFKADLTETLANPAVCTCQLKGLAVNGALGQGKFLEIPKIASGCDGGAPDLVRSKDFLPGTQTQLRISKIEIGNLSLVAGNSYRGLVRVSPDNTSTKSSFRPVEISQSFKLDASGRIANCVFDSLSAKTCSGNEILVGVDEKNFPICRRLPSCAPNQSLIGYDVVGNPTCRNLPTCASGRVLNSVNPDGSAVCIDGSQIANIPTVTETSTTVASNGTGSGSSSNTTPVSNTDNSVTEIIVKTSNPPATSFPTTTTLYGSNGNPTCTPGEGKKDQACSDKCVSMGATGGTFINSNCDKGQLQCICSTDLSRFSLSFASSTTGAPACPSVGEANTECDRACKGGGRSGGKRESCVSGNVQCLCH